MDKFSIKEFFATGKKAFFSSFLALKNIILGEKKSNKRYFYLIVIALIILLVDISLMTYYNVANSNKLKQQQAAITKTTVLPDSTFMGKITSLKIGEFSEPTTVVYSWQYLAKTSGGYNQPLMTLAETKSVYVQNVTSSNWQAILTKEIYAEGYSDDAMNGGYANLAFSNGKFFVKIEKVAATSLIIYFGVLPMAK
jgi:hypothetical protein